MDLFFYAAAALCTILLILMAASYGTNLKPKGDQNQSLVGLVYGTAFAFGVVGWLLAVWGFRGNAEIQTKFMLVFVFLVLLPTTIISATASASMLYGLRDAVAANRQAA